MNIRKPWEELKFSSRMKAYYEKDPRVPKGYKPGIDRDRPLSKTAAKSASTIALTRDELVTLRRGLTTIQVPRWFIEGAAFHPEQPTIRRVKVSELVG